MIYPDGFAKKFWSKVKKSRGKNACWVWLRGKTKSGYGQLQARKITSAPMLTHRVAWELTHGTIPDGLHVLHTCDNPACVRPEHLFLGTQVDNNKDRDRKGRVASGDRNGSHTRPDRNSFIKNRGSGLRGESHPRAKLSAAQIESLKADFASGVSMASLARKYGISQTHVGRIVRGKSWRSNGTD